MNGADISRAITRGYHPHLDPIGFAQAVRDIETARRNDDAEVRVRHVTKGRGYRLCRSWGEAQSMLVETGLEAPTWLGVGTGVEEWKREGNEAIFVFRPKNRAGGLMAFTRSRGGRWSRIL
jgi:hypothetical protein